MEQLLDYFKPTLYQLEECLFRKKSRFKGKVRIDGQLQQEDFVKLHAVNLDIKSISWCPFWQGYETASDEYASEPCDFTHEEGIITIPISAEMRAAIEKCREADEQSDLTLEITFESDLNRNMQGCYLSTYELDGVEQRIVATQFESHYAREAFPCIDEPAAKAEFDLTLIVPDYDPRRDVVLANTEVIGQVNGRFEFARTPRMSTYLLAWVAGPFQQVSVVNRNGVRVSTYGSLNQPLESLLFANQTAVRALEFYDEKFGTPYPLSKLDQVALPDFEAGAMENWGLVTYRESMMLAEPDASLDVKRVVATTVTHELSHQWFGNLVTMQWWDDLWLNESFATVIEYVAAAAIYPELDVWQDFFTGSCLSALKRDALPGVQAVKQPVHSPAEIATLFDGAIVYNKGARLILMLMRLMGEEQFYQGLRQYFAEYAYHNTVGDNLWAALQPFADFEIKDFMDAWISQPGYPALQKSSDGSWYQQRFLIDGTTDDTKWPLPEVKDDMSGHYLLDLTSEDFSEKLAQFDKLSMEQQLRILIDRMLLARTQAVASSSLLDLLPKFKDCDSATVFEIVATIISDLKLFCPPETEDAELYKAYLLQIFAPRFAKLNLGAPSASPTPASNAIESHTDTKVVDANEIAVRDILLSIARYCEHAPTLDRLVALYDDHLENIDPELRAHVLSAQFLRAEATVFDAWLERYAHETDPDLKRTLLAVLAGSAKEPAHLDRLLGLLEQPELVRPQDHIFLYIYLLRNHRTRSSALKWLTTHWDFVAQLTGDKSIEDYPRYAANIIQSAGDAELFYNFFNTKADEPVLARTLRVARVEIDSRLALRAGDSASVVAALQLKIKSNTKPKSK